MREILYIQAGPLSNFIGTHFWNQQSSYFTYGDEGEDSLTDHDTSFREGLTAKGDATFCPRLLVFDHKSKFGTLSQHNALTGVPEESEEDPLVWTGDVMEIKQDLITKSEYQRRMDEEGVEEEVADETPSTGDQMRYWSDFNRVYFAPRTIQKVPDPGEWENLNGDWETGRAIYSRYNEDNDLMEGSVRLFMEECDFLQGIQVMNDTSSFGAFTSSLLTSFMDDYIKLPSLVFPLLPASNPKTTTLDKILDVKNVLNDALCLRTLSELASFSVPIQAPTTWSNTTWTDTLNFDTNDLYATSALLSTHIESCTLPIRLRQSPESLAGFTEQLNWRGSTRFGQLRGSLPADFLDEAAFNSKPFEFSTSQLEKPISFARRDVSRGFSTAQISTYNKWSLNFPLPTSYVASYHAPTYTLPTSFPAFFRQTQSGLTSLRRPPDTTVFSSISTGTGTVSMLSDYASFVQECVRQRCSAGLDLDELKDLANDLWTLHDNNGVDDQEGDIQSEGLGEDEED